MQRAFISSMKKLYFGAVCLAALTIGCKSGPMTTLHSAPEPKVDAGWKTHSVPGEFSLAASDQWTVNLRAVVMSGLPSLSGTDPVSNVPEEVDPSDAERQKQAGELLVLYFKGAKPIPGEALTRLFVK